VRTFHHADFRIERLASQRDCAISVCLPAKGCAATIGPIVDALTPLREAGAIDEIVVIDASSTDGTGEVAAAHGATVYEEAALVLEAGPVRGKGDAMWRALTVLQGELIAYLDADTEGFGAHFATGVLGPLVEHPEIAFVKAFYRRPLGADPLGGGRVNHLMARPALRVFFPELADVRQPLAGEIAARRELLERLPFATGYGVETAMLIDAWRAVGLEGMAQVDLDEMINAHQPLHDLTPMAEAVLRVVASRAGVEGVEPLPERPPHVPA
jgi:glucosyl-3-phosphoglycerate synthase